MTDFGADFDYREIVVSCNIFPRHSFSALVSTLDDIAAWLDPVGGLKQLVLDDVPDRYFMARLSDTVDCERLLRAAGSFTLRFLCPDPDVYKRQRQYAPAGKCGCFCRYTNGKGGKPR